MIGFKSGVWHVLAAAVFMFRCCCVQLFVSGVRSVSSEFVLVLGAVSPRMAGVELSSCPKLHSCPVVACVSNLASCWCQIQWTGRDWNLNVG